VPSPPGICIWSAQAPVGISFRNAGYELPFGIDGWGAESPSGIGEEPLSGIIGRGGAAVDATTNAVSPAALAAASNSAAALAATSLSSTAIAAATIGPAAICAAR